MEERMNRKIVNLLDHTQEILSLFCINNYSKNKDGLMNAINDWLDSEYYTVKDKEQKLKFVEKYFNI